MLSLGGAFAERAHESGLSYEGVGAMLDKLEQSPNVDSVLLRFQSPGGVCMGCPELAGRMRKFSKPLYGIADSYAASAAYWLMAQCKLCWVTPSGKVGSIGVFAMHEDYSAALEKEGIKLSFVFAGDHKVENNPFEPMTAAGRAAMQKSVDGYYDSFVADVAKGRGVKASVVERDFGRGRLLGAADAKSAGLVDGIKTFAQALDVVTGMAASRRGANSQSALANRLTEYWPS